MAITEGDGTSWYGGVSPPQIADYALPVVGEFAAAEWHRIASSGAVWFAVFLHQRGRRPLGG